MSTETRGRPAAGQRPLKDVRDTAASEQGATYEHRAIDMDHDVVAEQGVAGKRSVIDEGFITDEGIADDDGIVDEADDAIDVDIIEDNAPAEPQAALFTGDNAAEFRSRWDAVQRNFVDDPAKALRDGDALVCELINELARVFADARTARESKQARGGAGATETMRLELRRRRALFETLLAL